MLLDVELCARELGRGLEEEMPFLLVMAAGVASTGLELVEAVKNAVNSRAFKAFKALSERFYALSQLLGASEALRLLTRIVSGRVRMLIAEYSSSLSSGTALSWLRDRASDLVKTAGVEFERQHVDADNGCNNSINGLLSNAINTSINRDSVQR